ncbi:MAG TPA: DUF423 domain-containing protein [Methylovirgula sp.]|nr:DUF423 domain-containing protein [Methylovirgula sp.]
MSGWPRALIAIAALMGAAGVIAAAASAHGTPAPLLDKAALFFLLDATAAIGICAAGLHATVRSSWFFLAASVLLVGSLLFGADLSMRSLTGDRLFPFAAPIGGTSMIVGWLLAAVAAIGGRFGRH